MSDILPELRKGALVAQNPPGFESITELEPSEREALRNEVLHKWRQPRALYMTVILCSVGAAVQYVVSCLAGLFSDVEHFFRGWDQTGSNGANLSFPVQFGIDAASAPNAKESDRDNWLVGLVNSAPYIASAFLCVTLCPIVEFRRSWLTGPIQWLLV
jgi:hypothetical protein